MQAFRLVIPRFGTRVPLACTTPASLTRLFLRKSLQARCYAQKAMKPSRLEQELQRQNRAALKSGTNLGMASAVNWVIELS
jgi:hypothetical protein